MGCTHLPYYAFMEFHVISWLVNALNALWFQHLFLSFFFVLEEMGATSGCSGQWQVMKYASPAHAGLPIIKYT